MTPVTTVVELESAKKLLEQLFLHHPEQNRWRDSADSLLYRGVGDERYELIPTALRSDSASHERFGEISQSTGTNIAHPRFQHQAEWFVIREFYRFANRNGLSLPRLPDEYHHSIALCDDLSTSDLWRPDRLDWPPAELEPLMALAQHYGLPTRLLDWTTDPLVSLHFAAVSAMKRLEDDKNRRPTHLAVWSTSIGHLEFANCLNSKCGPHIVHPPRADNPNLTAQRGVFTLCRQKIAMPVKNNQEIDRRPLNEQVAATLSARTSEEKEEFAKRFGWLDYNPPFFIKYTLPIGQAPILYDLLQARGYDSGRLYPGFGGAAQSVMNAATVLRLRLRN